NPISTSSVSSSTRNRCRPSTPWTAATASAAIRRPSAPVSEPGQPEFGGQLDRSRPPGPVRADGARRGAVADQVDAGVRGDPGGQPPGHGDAAAGPAQPQRGEVIERTTETGGPQDHLGG